MASNTDAPGPPVNDLQEFSQFMFSHPTDDIPDTMTKFLLMNLAADSNRIDRKFGHVHEAKNIISAHPELVGLLQSAWKASNFEPILNFPSLQVQTPTAQAERYIRRRLRPHEEQEYATEKSWTLPFRGNAAEGLWEHIRANYNRGISFPLLYAHHAAIIQSSGTGKSRTVDELAKEHFVIMVNFNEPGTTGYPRPDNDVRSCLLSAYSRERASNQAGGFLGALFEHTLHTLRTDDYNGLDYVELASKFRKRMTEGQTMKAHNAYRSRFYEDVAKRARQLENQSWNTTYDRFELLAQHLESLYDRSPLPSPLGATVQGEQKARFDNSFPLVVVAFDEAHTLTQRRGQEGEEWSMFHEFRHLLRRLRDLPLFSLFLSTTDKFSPFESTMKEDFSKRTLDSTSVVVQPYTDFGFDHFANKMAVDGSWFLEQLTTDAHIFSMGRPLFITRYLNGSQDVQQEIIQFAAIKLINVASVPVSKELSKHQTLACLAQRFPIEFNSTDYISQENERTQVGRHMRVCLKIDGPFETVSTTSCSEPVLSEAAYYLMQNPLFNAPKALKSVMEGFAMSKGDHGELLVLLMLILARDATVGETNCYGQPETGLRFFGLTDFLHGELFREEMDLSKNSAQALCELLSDFPDAQLHFSHFVKVHENSAIDLTSLLLLQGRGAAVLCANSQGGVNATNVFLKDGKKLARGNAGLILHHVENDSSYTDQPRQDLFDAMDPFNLEILKKGEDQAVPLIKIVFALAAEKSSLSVVRKEPTTECPAIIYEIWCAGLSPDILGPIKEEDEDVWESLLQASYSWKELYDAPSDVIKALRQSMTPGAARDDGHYSCWATRED